MATSSHTKVTADGGTSLLGSSGDVGKDVAARSESPVSLASVVPELASCTSTVLRTIAAGTALVSINSYTRWPKPSVPVNHRGVDSVVSSSGVKWPLDSGVVGVTGGRAEQEPMTSRHVNAMAEKADVRGLASRVGSALSASLR